MAILLSSGFAAFTLIGSSEGLVFVSSGHRHHGHRASRRDQIDADNEAHRPDGAAWPSIDGNARQQQVEEPARWLTIRQWHHRTTTFATAWSHPTWLVKNLRLRNPLILA